MKPSTTRREFVSALTVAGIAAVGGAARADPQEESAMPSDPLTDLLKASMSDKRGVTLALVSGSVALVVTELTDAYVLGRSQQHDRIVVRREHIQAAYQ